MIGIWREDMYYNYLYSVMCIISSILAISLSIFGSVHYKSSTFAKPFSALMLFVGVYTFGYAFEILKGDINWIYLWIRVEYVGLSFTGACWVWLALSFTRNFKILNRTFFVIMTGISLFFLVAVLTNDIHHLYYSSISLNDYGEFQTANLGRGILYIAHMIWFFVSLIVSAVLYIRYFLNSKSIFKDQSFFMVLISIGCLAGLVLDMSGLVIGGYDLDIGPLNIIINTSIGAIAIIKTGILDISPIARDKVFESLKDGVIVTDLYGAVTDYNSTAQTVLPALSKEWIGKDLFEIAPQLKHYSKKHSPHTFEPFIVGTGKELQYYEISNFPIQDAHKIIGTAWYLMERTEHCKIMNQLKEYAEKDELTKIWNRRKLLELAEEAVFKAKKGKETLALMILDIDYFKKINDTMGHHAGDSVLIHLTEMIGQELRDKDIFGRLGGEEFAVLFPETNQDEVSEIANRILAKVSHGDINLDGMIISVTISAGITIYQIIWMFR